MLTVYRGNRAETLAELLATQLRLDPPDPFTVVEVVVNTWPTSRWLGEQLAWHLGGVAANLRFPFPGSHLRRLVDELLDDADPATGPADGDRQDGGDPWRADRLVWTVLPALPIVAASEEGEPLRRWLGERDPERSLGLDTWRLARSIADALDDYSLYRPELLLAWEHGDAAEPGEAELPPNQRWQPLLYRELRRRLPREPFALRVERAVQLLRQRSPVAAAPQPPLRLFGLSSLAPQQVRLLQAISGQRPVDLFLLSPCPDLWRRCGDRRQQLRDALALRDPLDGDWLRQAPGLEARFGRLGAEFHQLLEGSGEAQLGESREADLFLLPATAAGEGPTLLRQLQEQLADPEGCAPLFHQSDDHSLEFHACPGPLRQVQIVRDRLLQLLALHADLEPRDILVMTPQVEALAPLVAAVFGDPGATGVQLPWRLTDRSQQGDGGMAACLLALLEQAGERLTASGLERILECASLLQRFQLEAGEGARLNGVLQACGFRWGLDGAQRNGPATHSLSWVIDRLLLSLVLPARPGLAPGAPPTAPAGEGAPLDLSGRWLHLLTRLRHWLTRLGQSATVADWVERLGQLLADLFSDAEGDAAERAALLAALEEWRGLAADAPSLLEAPVVAAILTEMLRAESGRFGHRSGALTISALEPMRAIPHRVIVLMGLDGSCFPRGQERPGFHLLDQRRRLGDPNPADQDRYSLLEALLSARDHLLVTWSCRDDRLGEELPPAGPVRQWLEWLDAGLPGGVAPLLVRHPASPLETRNFLPTAHRPPASCDRRWLEAHRQLAAAAASPLVPLVRRPMPAAGVLEGRGHPQEAVDDPFCDLQEWLIEPQRQWLRQLGLRPSEWDPGLEDLEPLRLDELGRTALLRSLGDPQAPGLDAEAWLAHTRGQGLLPAGSAAALEARTLANRQRNLQHLASELGAAGEACLAWGPWRVPCRWQGDALVVMQLGKAHAPHRLDLWLQLLVASAAAGDAPPLRRGLLLAREGPENYAIDCTFPAPAPKLAREELERLQHLRGQWRARCWPVPPRSGWSWGEAEGRVTGSGLAAARTTWEGGPDQNGERDRPEMALCFGADLPTTALVGGDFARLAGELLTPVLEALVPPGRGRSGARAGD